jgi:hypothetical protein
MELVTDPADVLGMSFYFCRNYVADIELSVFSNPRWLCGHRRKERVFHILFPRTLFYGSGVYGCNKDVFSRE